MSRSSVPGSTHDDVVRRSISRQAENPVPRENGSDILEKWSAAGMATLLSSPGQVAAQHALCVLSPLLHSFVQHYFRLDRTVRMLEARVRIKNRGNGWKATRQIELERQRLGRELHTGVGQMLAAVRLQLELVTAHLAEPPVAVRQGLERIAILVRNALEEVRSISKRLHPPDWQRLTLEEALSLLWQMSGIPERYQTDFQIGHLHEEPDLNRKILIYRCLQEALSNVTRHSRAKQVNVSLQSTQDSLVLTVTDDGVGFDAERLFAGTPSAVSGIGLQAVRQHAAILGGKLVIQSSPVGTKLELTVPVPKD